MNDPRRARIVRQAAAVLLLAGVFAGALSLALGARLDEADFTFNNGTEVQTLDPATVTGVPEGRVLRALFEGLVVKHPKTLEPEPGMAERWERSDDGLVYTFHIRQGARWTNGDPVTAHDFVFSWERFLNPKTAADYAYQLWYVKGAKAYTTEVDESGGPRNSWDSVGVLALDDHTLEVTLDSPTPFFLALTGFYPLFPVNRRNIEEAQEQFPDDWQIQWLRPDRIVTNGPYKVISRRVNDRIRLAKNEDYWDADSVAFKTIDVLAMEQESTMLNVYLTGGADFIDRVNTNVAHEMMEREDFNPAPYMGTYFYRVNTTKPPFDDARVRRALSMTIPRVNIVDKVEQMGQKPAYSLVPPVLHNYTSAECEKEDIAKAKALLVEAGYGPGGKTFPTIEIHYNTSEAHAAIAQVIMIAWQNDLGIKAKLRNEEWKVYLDTQNTKRYDVSRAAWIGDYADPNTFIDMFVTDGENNKTGWGNPQYDQYVAAAARELDEAKRMEIMRKAEEILMAELPILPIYFYVDKNIVAPRVGGFYPNALDEHFPKHWYWMDDQELAEKRNAQPAEWKLVDPHGPSKGLYPPSGRPNFD